MRNLTEEQKEKLQVITEEQKEKFLVENQIVLFDIKKVINKGETIREELDNLKLTNELTKQLVKQQFEADVQKVREFLGEYADAVIVSEDERCGNYYYSIGVNDDNKVFVTYPYGKEDFIDWQNYIEIDEKKYQQYKQYDIDVYQHGYDNENHIEFETMFNDNDVVEMFETAVQDYIVYHKPKEDKEYLNNIN
jgi:hypothetical protein